MEKITIKGNMETMLPSLPSVEQASIKGGESFDEMLAGAVSKVSRLQNEANQATQGLAAGKTKDLHQTMIAIEKAGVSFQLLMQVRNKIVSAYQEIMRTPA